MKTVVVFQEEDVANSWQRNGMMYNMLMTKNKTKINKNTTTNNTTKRIVGYGIIAAWISFLAITDYSSWLGSYHSFMGSLYPPVSDIILYALLFIPTAIASLPIAYYYAQDNADKKDSSSEYFLIALQIIVINVVSVVAYFLLNVLFHGFF